MSCSICNARKEKRFCLAVHGRICAQCCGEQREVTLDCPAECPYLQQSRLHQKSGDAGEAPPVETFPAIELTEDFLDQHEPLIAGMLHLLAKASRADRNLNDRELISTLANMARSYQTLVASGLVYQEGSTNPMQRELIDLLEELLQAFRQLEQKHLGHTTLTDGDVLKSLIFTLRLAHLHTSGRPRSRAFIDFLHQRFPPSQDSPEPAHTGSRIIIP